MALKVVLLLFLAMFVLTMHNAMAQQPDPVCAALCVVRCNSSPLCMTRCLAACPKTTNTHELVDTEAETRNRVCNVGCSLGHCPKFLINYDNEKFGSCMTSCNENYCIGGNVALEKA